MAFELPPLPYAFDALERFAKTEVSVTLVGETGAGKDILAHALHSESSRASGPFVVFDCGAVAANLAESELLGHERGAFTGAVSSHVGAFERAHGGTLFLDEIGEMPVELQPRLLRALESRHVRRVGGKQERKIDVRIVAATNRDLRNDVANGKFREDLFFRLAVAVVPVPSLRRRLDDLPYLVPSLLSSLGRPDLVVAESAYAVLQSHSWPGNVRELKNALACALAFVDPGALALEASHLSTAKPTDSPASPFMPRLARGTATSRLHSSSTSRASSGVPSSSRDTCVPLAQFASMEPSAPRATSRTAPSAVTSIAYSLAPRDRRSRKPSSRARMSSSAA